MEEGRQKMVALTPKIRAFYGRNPDLWFAMAESSFVTAEPKITSGLTKSHYLMQVLDEDTALRVKDLIVNPPQDSYEALKTRLLQSFKLTRGERASWILDYPDLGNKKATRMADELINLFEGHCVDLLREIFLHRLPQRVRIILEEDETLRYISWRSWLISCASRNLTLRAWHQ